MRLWSLHPKYLDATGLVALWREGLLARKVLQNRTKGYKNHPQLLRFKKQKNPVAAIDAYMKIVLLEAKKRGYAFTASKIKPSLFRAKIPVTKGQIAYEFNHLKKKLAKRNRQSFLKIIKVKIPGPNQIFKVVKGNVEEWEKVAVQS